MKRNDFIKSACALGICSCAGPAILTGNGVKASDLQDVDWNERFVKHRFSKLIDILDASLDEEVKNQIIEKLGQECSLESFAGDFKDNPEGFLEEIKKRWGENSTYDRDKGFIRIETPERDCVCPLVDSRVISESICQCSVGWQTQTYQTIFGKNVEARCVESVIRGGKKCVFEIQILDS